MRTLSFLIAGALLVCGCSAQAAHESAPASASVATTVGASAASLDGNWRFVEIAGSPVPAGVTATLRLRAGHASGKAGCNAYGATWTSSPDGATSFGSPRSTKMACLTPAGAMRVERGVFDALALAARMHRDGAGLLLLDAAGKPLARLQPQVK